MMFDRYLEAIKHMDFFQREVVMNIDDQTRHRTNLGLILSVCVLGFLTFASYILGSDIVEKKVPSVIQKKQQAFTVDDLSFSPQTRYFAFTLQDYENWDYWVDESYFSVEIQVQHTNRVKFENGTWSTEFVNNAELSKILKPERCDLEKHFKTEELKKILPPVELNKLYCFPQPLIVGGNYDYGLYKSIVMSFRRCDESIDLIKCQPKQAIDLQLKKNYVTFYTVSSALDQSNHDKPLLLQPTSTYSIVSVEFPKEMIISMSRQQVLIDDGVFSQDFTGIYEQTYIEEMKQIVVHDEVYFLKVTLDASRQFVQYTFTYKKLPSLIAELTALTNIVLFILSFIFLPIFQKDYYMKIIKQLFAPDQVGLGHSLLKTAPTGTFTNNNNQSNNTNTQSNNSPQNKNQDQNYNHNVSEFQLKSYNKSLEPPSHYQVLEQVITYQPKGDKNQKTIYTIDDTYRKEAQMHLQQPLSHVINNNNNYKSPTVSEKQIDVNFASNQFKDQQQIDLDDIVFEDEVKQILYQDRKHIVQNVQKDQKLFQFFSQTIFNSIDVIELLQGFHQIETLKYLLLSPQQITFFDYISQPSFANIDDQYFIRFHNQSDEEINPKQTTKEQNLKVMQQYFQLQDEFEIQGNQLSGRIIKAMDPEIQSLFQSLKESKNQNQKKSKFLNCFCKHQNFNFQKQLQTKKTDGLFRINYPISQAD